MLWAKYKDLAYSLRNQGLADCLAARFALRPVALTVFGEPVTFAHVVVSKSQQAVEKLTKGYLLWHSQSFDPTKGHAPFTELMTGQPQNHERALERLIQAINRGNKSIVTQLKWLERLAPNPPTVADELRGHLQPLEIIRENTEYPYWSAAKRQARNPGPGAHAVAPRRHSLQYLAALSHGVEQVGPSGILPPDQRVHRNSSDEY